MPRRSGARPSGGSGSGGSGSGGEPDRSDRSEGRGVEDEVGEEGLFRTFEQSVDEGSSRLSRSWRAQLATGFVGGLDIGLGVLALLFVRHETGSEALGALAFTVGFVALVLARSELFTEDFLVPIMAIVVHRKYTLLDLVRLWSGTFAANLVGGAVFMALFVGATDPDIDATTRTVGAIYPELGIGWTSFASAVLAGMAITLMTWMELGRPSVFARVAAAIIASFTVAVVPLNHAIVGALEMFGALFAGASFGYAEAAGTLAWATFGNIVGGVGLVTLLRLVQVGPTKVRAERAADAG